MRNFISALNDFSKSLDEDKEDLIGFTTEINNDIRFKLLRKGWWHLYYFASDISNQYGMRILPKEKLTEWSICRTSRFSSTVTFAPKISNFFYFSQLNIISEPTIYAGLSNEINLIEKYANEFLILTKGLDDFNFFKKYVLNPDNSPISDSNKMKMHESFLKYFDKSDGYNFLSNIIKEILNNENYFPDSYPEGDLGIWETRIANILGQRAYVLQDELITYEIAELFLWKSFIQPHAYDSENVNIKFFANASTESYMNIDCVARLLTSDYNKHSLDIKKSPLYGALVSLESNVRSYLGVQHMEAAAIFDLEYNDPIMAWNCLVSAAYWSGLNSNETFIPAWEAAIELCEKNNWKDAFEALSYQLEFYNEYKRKNNIV